MATVGYALMMLELAGMNHINRHRPVVRNAAQRIYEAAREHAGDPMFQWDQWNEGVDWAWMGPRGSIARPSDPPLPFYALVWVEAFLMANEEFRGLYCDVYIRGRVRNVAKLSAALANWIGEVDDENTIANTSARDAVEASRRRRAMQARKEYKTEWQRAKREALRAA